MSPTPTPTPTLIPLDRRRALRTYCWGHAWVLLGAWSTSEIGSMWPLALGGAAALMMTVPLVRSFMQPARTRR